LDRKVTKVTLDQQEFLERTALMVPQDQLEVLELLAILELKALRVFQEPQVPQAAMDHKAPQGLQE